MKNQRLYIFPFIFAVFLALTAPPGSGAQSSVQPLAGTSPMNRTGDLSFEVLDRVDRFLMESIDRSEQERQALWSQDYSSAAAYEESISENRERFRKYIGLVDTRQPFTDLELVDTTEIPALVAESGTVLVYSVRWPVLEGVWAEGLLLEPRTKIQAQVVAVPDADWTPEIVAGLDPEAPEDFAFGLRLAEAGVRTLVPTIIDRDNTWSGNPRVRMSNQTHREFIYRQAYFMGRHMIGYEVQKILAAVDYFTGQIDGTDEPLPIGVAGYGEGGLLALYSGASDPRIHSTFVSGYFEPREEVWKEPVYRNVWGLLHEFGDAGIARLINPRTLVIEACQGPETLGPPPPRDGRMDAASGRLRSPRLSSVIREFEHAREQYQKLGFPEEIRLVQSQEGEGPPATDAGLTAFLNGLGIQPVTISRGKLLNDLRPSFDPGPRMKRQFSQLVDFSQKLMYTSTYRRKDFWSRADRSSPESWEKSTRFYRDYFWKEIVGWLPPPEPDPNPKTRLIYETPLWKGYEVTLTTWGDVFSYGIVLVPRGIKAGERRPVVVAQHGRGGRPQDVCNPHEDTRAYHSFGARLADRGFVVYAPQNLYIGEEKYRMLQRKANPLKLTFFAPMVRQHEQALQWLRGLPFVDGSRIGFYGLSYGGKSAMFIPAILQDYALSICSGDFNEEVWKHVTIEEGYSFLLTNEHEHTEFDFGDKFNYAELAGLIAPRPFMVERGHNDGVGKDEWVAFEYAKVRRLYVKLGIGDLTEIEYFDGPHEIHGDRTFDFLHRFLKWPLPEKELN